MMESPDPELLVASLPCREETTLDLPPSCIDFSYFHPRSFVVGTYYLEEPQPSGHTTPSQQDDDGIERPVQERRGSLTLFRFGDDNGL